MGSNFHIGEHERDEQGLPIVADEAARERAEQEDEREQQKDREATATQMRNEAGEMARGW